MSADTIGKVKEIERHAVEIIKGYDLKLQKIKDETEKTVTELENEKENQVKVFKNEQTEKGNNEFNALKNTYEQNEKEQLDELKATFNNKKDQLVDAVVEEVMRKYGNS